MAFSPILDRFFRTDSASRRLLLGHQYFTRRAGGKGNWALATTYVIVLSAGEALGKPVAGLQSLGAHMKGGLQAGNNGASLYKPSGSVALTIWFWHLLVRYPGENGGMRYETDFIREKPHDSGSVPSDAT